MVHRGVRKATRPSVQAGRAKSSAFRGDVNIVNEKLRSDYGRGTFWAGVAFVLVMGPLLVMHALGWF